MRLFKAEVKVRAENQEDAVERIEDMISNDLNSTIEEFNVKERRRR